MKNYRIAPSWECFLKKETQKDYMKKLWLFLEKEYSSKTIYPERQNLFKALQTPVEKVKVVILGQDPYHGPDQAHGLSFSVQNGVRHPPSLKNIFKELGSDLGLPTPTSGDLTSWAEQGVLLLNATLSVEESKAGSHQNKGWEVFTDAVLNFLNKEKSNLVFILWGSFAQKKASFINENSHYIIKSAHPSPLSAYRGFWGSKPFSKTNEFLKSKNIQPIEWRL